MSKLFTDLVNLSTILLKAATDSEKQSIISAIFTLKKIAFKKALYRNQEIVDSAIRTCTDITSNLDTVISGTNSHSKRLKILCRNLKVSLEKNSNFLSTNGERLIAKSQERIRKRDKQRNEEADDDDEKSIKSNSTFGSVRSKGRRWNRNPRKSDKVVKISVDEAPPVENKTKSSSRNEEREEVTKQSTKGKKKSSFTVSEQSVSSPKTKKNGSDSDSDSDS